MKHLLIIIIAATALLTGCKNKDDKPTIKEKLKVEVGKKATSEVLTAAEIEFIEGNLNFIGSVAERDAAAKAPRKKAPPVITVAATEPTLTHNSGSSFTVNYNGQTNVVWTFFRCGDEQSASGNVIPLTAGPSFYKDPQPVTTFNAWCSGLFYQAVVVTGTTTPDANGVVGADWVMTYSNVVQ